MIYLVAHTKGGVTKSTLAVHLAAHFSTKGKTLLIDTDKQATAATWSSWRSDQKVKNSPTTVILLGDQVFKQGKVLANDYDFVIIDSGGKDNQGMRYAMLLADHLIIPTADSDFDTAAFDDMKEIIEGAKINNEKLTAKVVLSRVHSARKYAPAELKEFLTDRGFELYKTMIPQLDAFKDATNKGLTVFETKTSQQASNSIKSLIKELPNG